MKKLVGNEKTMLKENENNTTRMRIMKWDNLKFFLIFLVVLGHILEEFILAGNANWGIKRARFFIYLFHIPLFIFISGIFSKKNIDNKRYSNIFYYLILYFVVKIILFICNIFKGKYSLSMFSEGGVPWYCFALFAFNLITILLRDFNKKYIFIFSIILGCIVGYDPKISDFLVLSRIIVLYPFFFIGYCLDGDKIIKILSHRTIKVISVIVFLMIGILIYTYIKDIYWMTPLLSCRNPFIALKNKAYLGGILRLVYYIIVILLGTAIISITPSGNKIKTFAKWGSRSLQVYILHYPLIKILLYALRRNKWNESFDG